MIQKSRCGTGCAIQAEAGDKVCKRCFKAVETEVESPQEKYQREMKEQKEFIAIAEEARERILARVESLTPKNHLLVMSYFGGEFSNRGYPSPLTPMGRALGIVLLSEAIVAMVPEAERPWMVDGKATDIDEEEVEPCLPSYGNDSEKSGA